MKQNEKTRQLMSERFGHDMLIAVATTENGRPNVRTVDAYYEDGSFYVITYALSGKMKQIADNPTVAVCGEWFTAHGTGINLGYVRDEKNAEIFGKLKNAFSAWYDNGHTDDSDPNTCILQIKLSDGLLFSHGERFDIDFTEGE